MFIVIVGDPGTGKTVSAATFPKPMMFMDWDDGAVSLKYARNKEGQLIIPPEELKQISIIDFKRTHFSPVQAQTILKGKFSLPHTVDAPKMMDTFNNSLNSIREGNYKTLVIDSLTTMFRVWKEAVCYHMNQPLLQIQDYNTLDVMLYGQFIPALRALPVDYVILIDHIAMEVDKVTGLLVEFPVGPSRNTGRQLPKEFDEVWRQMVIGDEKYVWKTKRGNELLQTKTRHHIPDGVEANFNSIKDFLIPVDSEPQTAV